MENATSGLRPLPILTVNGELPSGKALAALREAKLATGYTGKVLPAIAAPGSPAPILAVGEFPSWITKFAYLPDWSSVTRLTAALTAVLIDNDDPRLLGDEFLLSRWMGGAVKLIGIEDADGTHDTAIPDNWTGRWEDME